MRMIKRNIVRGKSEGNHSERERHTEREKSTMELKWEGRGEGRDTVLVQSAQ